MGRDNQHSVTRVGWEAGRGAQAPDPPAGRCATQQHVLAVDHAVADRSAGRERIRARDGLGQDVAGILHDADVDRETGFDRRAQGHRVFRIQHDTDIVRVTHSCQEDGCRTLDVSEVRVLICGRAIQHQHRRNGRAGRGWIANRDGIEGRGHRRFATGGVFRDATRMGLGLGVDREATGMP